MVVVVALELLPQNPMVGKALAVTPFIKLSRLVVKAILLVVLVLLLLIVNSNIVVPPPLTGLLRKRALILGALLTVSESRDGLPTKGCRQYSRSVRWWY